MCRSKRSIKRFSSPLTEEQINTAVSEYEVHLNSTQYQKDRANEYPSIVDQLDDIYHNGIDGWKATIKVTRTTTLNKGNIKLWHQQLK